MQIIGNIFSLIQQRSNGQIPAPRNRPQHDQLSVHGEVQDDGTTYIGSGIDQWISDWVVSRGQDVTVTFGTAIRGLDSMLGNKIGGFLDSANLKAQADNFGLLPSEDVLVNSYLSKSSSGA